MLYCCTKLREVAYQQPLFVESTNKHIYTLLLTFLDKKTPMLKVFRETFQVYYVRRWSEAEITCINHPLQYKYDIVQAQAGRYQVLECTTNIVKPGSHVWVVLVLGGGHTTCQSSPRCRRRHDIFQQFRTRPLLLLLLLDMWKCAGEAEKYAIASRVQPSVNIFPVQIEI